MKQNPIEVFLASNDNYAQHLGVTIASILKNASQFDRLNFYVMYNNFSQENKDKILELKQIKNCSIKFVQMDYVDNLPEFLHISKEAYFRLKIHELFPHLNKALYLDCDIVVKSSLLPLWNTNIDSYCLAAATDILNYAAGHNEFAANRIKIITKSLDNHYFNSGVILFNLKELREFDFTEKFLAYAKNNQEILRYGDQDILNGIFINKVKFIDQSWNFDQRFQNGINVEPKIIHYTTDRKPWIYNDSYFQSYYDEYLKMTPWGK